MNIDGADLIVGSTLGNVVLAQCRSCKPSDELVREPAFSVGSDRPTGTVKKAGAQFLELDIRPTVVPEVAWATLHKSGETITFTIQYRAGSTKGERWQFRCQVAECNRAPEVDKEGGDSYGLMVKLVVIGEGRKVAG